MLRSVGSALGLGVPRLRFGGTDPGQVARALDEAPAAVRAAMRSTILEHDTSGNPRVHGELLAVTHSQSYVAAPARPMSRA